MLHFRLMSQRIRERSTLARMHGTAGKSPTVYAFQRRQTADHLSGKRPPDYQGLYWRSTAMSSAVGTIMSDYFP
ncbi:MAG: hypothetical protein WC405_01110 [Syntrophales bacterium]